LPQSLSECDSEYLLQILESLLSANDKFQPFKAQIVSYFTEHRIDGSILSAMKRKEFANNLIKHCDNKKIKGSAGALYKKLIEFDFSTNKSEEAKNECKVEAETKVCPFQKHKFSMVCIPHIIARNRVQSIAPIFE